MKLLPTILAASFSTILIAACDDNSKSDASDAGLESDGAGGNAAGAGGGAGAASAICTPSGDRVVVEVDPPPQDTGTDFDWMASGVITQASTNTFTVDPCVSDAGCTSEPSNVDIDASGLALTLPIGAYVSVHLAQAAYNGGHLQTILSVRNLASWAGTPNPVSTTETWYLLAIDGLLAHPDAPFEASESSLDCTADGEFYELAFREPGGPWFTVPYGQVATLTLAGQAWKANVVRSFRPAGYDYANAEAWWFSYDPG